MKYDFTAPIQQQVFIQNSPQCIMEVPGSRLVVLRMSVSPCELYIEFFIIPVLPLSLHIYIKLAGCV